MGNAKVNDWNIGKFVNVLHQAQTQMANINEDLLTEKAKELMQKMKEAMEGVYSKFEHEGVQYTTQEVRAGIMGRHNFFNFLGVSMDPHLDHDKGAEQQKAPKCKKKTMYKCDQCTTTFLSYVDKESHCRNAHEQESFKCDICNRPFKFKKGLNEHKKTFHRLGYKYNCWYKALHD